MIIQKTCTPSPLFSGERFSVTYRIFGNEKDARAKADDICIEQTETYGVRSFVLTLLGVFDKLTP